ncbi:MAG: redoxin domain-containing protein [Clostridiales bacterium]|jgi:peroxiredoxin|nr:redoxin domain-containing protein [Clostridiales bacterium]
MFGRKNPSVGKKAPDFTLPSSEKENITLSSYLGKTVLLVFLRSSG